MLTLNDGRSELWQWDTGRTLSVDADCSQVHFSNKVFGRSIDVDVVGGVAVIPDILLQTDKDLNVWAFVGTAENGYTKISKTFTVNRRNKPADYVFAPADQTSLEEIKERLEYIEQNPVEVPVQSVNGRIGAVELNAEDVGAISVETDPTVPGWAKQPEKPTYTAADVGALPDTYTPPVDSTMTKSGQAADAAVVGNRLSALSDENVKSAELDENNMVSFKNADGIVLFTLDLSSLGTPASYGNLVLSAESLTVEEGGTGSFTVALDSAPSANQIVYLAVSDNTRLTVSPVTLTFTPENYATPQTVTVTSAQDDDKDDNTITVTLTSSKVDAKQVLVNITDDDKYVPFGGKEVVSFIRTSSFATVDSITTYYDEANDETITQNGQPFIWPFKTWGPDASREGTPTKARGLLEANTTGAYSLIEVWNGIALPNKSNNSSGMASINLYAISNAYSDNGWESIVISLVGMKYRNTAGELATQTLAETVSNVLTNELPFTTEGWTKGFTTTVFTATGEVVFYCGNVEVYRIAAPADFVSWDWDLSARNWADLRYLTSEPRDSIIIVNDAVTPEDITKFYEHEVEANF